MTYRDIRIVGDPVLRTPCDPIREVTAGIKQLVEDLLENVNEDGRAGLAANQIGVSFRAFSWNIEGNIGYILNPVIVELSEETQDGPEGCLSVPDLWFPTTRSMYARAEGTNLDGKRVVVEGEEIWGGSSSMRSTTWMATSTSTVWTGRCVVRLSASCGSTSDEAHPCSRRRIGFYWR